MDKKKFKFDVVIGNPPYQEDAPGDSTSDKPIYHLFMDSAYMIGRSVELITPARFLFNAGATPKKWNRKMLNSEHIKTLYYTADASKVFPNTAITGGVVVTYFNESQKFTPIKTFIPFKELRSINNKVHNYKNFENMSSIVSGRTPYSFTDQMHAENPHAKEKLSKGHAKDISSNAFKALPEVFVTTGENSNEYCRVLGRLHNKRTYLWIKRKYAKGREDGFISRWKVFLPKANGASGMLGKKAARMISKPTIGKPNDIATDTFLVVGSFETREEAVACLKYLESKFARALLGTLKVTQINSKETWRNVPVQNFSAESDIDWSASAKQIDLQLYNKYLLDNDEINFIETHIKEMD